MSGNGQPIPLAGLRVTPYASYLSALGLLSILEQGWSGAQGAWQSGHFVAQGPSQQELIHFLTAHYSPTPVASPWNAGSGFYSADQSALHAIESSQHSRFQDYRDMLAVVRTALSNFGLEQAPEGTAKTELLRALRDAYSPRARRWLDTAVNLKDEQASYSSLLFTGGNDGKLDFGRNYTEAISHLLIESSQERSSSLLQALLFERDHVELPSQSLGAFDPTTAEGLNGASDGDSSPRSNPWAQILLVEGLLSLGGLVSYQPHTPTGQPSLVTKEVTKKDLLLPLWQQPMTLSQLRQRVQKKSPLITGHQRFVTAQRNGRAHFIIPVDGLPPRAHLWNPPLQWLRANRKEQRYLKAVAQGGLTPALEELGRLQLHSTDLPSLSHEWIAAANDGSDEFALALALSGLGAGVDLKADLHLRPQMANFRGATLPQAMIKLLRTRVAAANLVTKNPNRVGIRLFNDPFWSSRPASPKLIGHFLDSKLNEARVHTLVHALCLLLPGTIEPPQKASVNLLPYPYRFLKLAFHQWSQDRRPAPLHVLDLLSKGQVESALRHAIRFLTQRHPQLTLPPQMRGPFPTGPRLAAALLLPISKDTYQALLESVTEKAA